MSKKKPIGLGSKIEFSTPTPESFDGEKQRKQAMLDDEAGMMDEPIYWPHMARCPDCGRFMKRGIANWAKHTTEDCPFFKKNKKASGILRYAEHNYEVPYMTPKLDAELSKALEEYFGEKRSAVIGVGKHRGSADPSLKERIRIVKELKKQGKNVVLIGNDPYEKIVPPTKPTELVFRKREDFEAAVVLPETRQERRRREKKKKKRKH